MAVIGSVTPGFGSDPLALWRGVDDAVRGLRVERRPEPPIQPPAVILPRTASWMNLAPPASQSAAASPSPVLQLA